ncbi:MAG: VOC family protein [Pseudomonadales bacterium]|nr:VOC family protein [Pseudomonadales bacterium]
MNADEALFKKHEITGIGLCVPDVIACARQYGELLGVGPWKFFEQQLDDGRHLRTAEAKMGRLNVELRQPMKGEPTNRFHHISIGPIEDFGGVLEDVKVFDVSVDLHENGSGSCHAMLDTTEMLGTRLEMHKVHDRHQDPFAEYAPTDSLVKIQDKDIVQLGIVVDDVERFADCYSRMFGIEDWSFLDFSPGAQWRGIYRGLPLSGQQFHIKAGLAMHGDMQIELLQPTWGVSTHMDFLKESGNGVHHVSFGQVPDHDELVTKLRAGGVEIEMAGEVGTGAWFTYFRSAHRLGTIFEMVGGDPGPEVRG